MVRLQFTICDTKKGAAITDVNERGHRPGPALRGHREEVRHLHHAHALLGQITAPESWGLEGVDNQQPWGLLFFNKKLQDAYKVVDEGAAHAAEPL